MVEVIKKGAYLVDGQILWAEDAAGREASFISLYFGEDVQEADAQKAGALFEEVCPGAEVAVLSGGQPVYYYIISME